MTYVHLDLILNQNLKQGWEDQVEGDLKIELLLENLEIELLLENLEKEHHKENLEKEHLLKGQEHHREGRGHLEDLEESKQNLI